MLGKEHRALFLSYGINWLQKEKHSYNVFEGIVRETMSLDLKGCDCKATLRPQTCKRGLSSMKVMFSPRTASSPVLTADEDLRESGICRSESSQGLPGRVPSLQWASDYCRFSSLLYQTRAFSVATGFLLHPCVVWSVILFYYYDLSLPLEGSKVDIFIPSLSVRKLDPERVWPWL